VKTHVREHHVRVHLDRPLPVRPRTFDSLRKHEFGPGRLARFEQSAADDGE
jgi:hypothetical protein